MPATRRPGGILVERIYRPLAAASHAPLLQTATAYLETGGSLEATARALFVHPNTVRYRLRRISDVTGYDLTAPREAWTLRIALALGRLAADTGPVRCHARLTAPRLLEDSSKVSATTSWHSVARSSPVTGKG